MIRRRQGRRRDDDRDHEHAQHRLLDREHAAQVAFGHRRLLLQQCGPKPEVAEPGEKDEQRERDGIDAERARREQPGQDYVGDQARHLHAAVAQEQVQDALARSTAYECWIDVLQKLRGVIHVGLGYWRVTPPRMEAQAPQTARATSWPCQYGAGETGGAPPTGWTPP